MADNKRGKGGGTVYKEQDGTWTASLEWGFTKAGNRRRRRSKGHPSRSAAEAALRKMQREREDKGAIDLTKQTVGVFLEEWLELVVVGSNKRANTVRAYRWAVGHIKRHLGKVRLSALGPERVQQMYSALREEGLSDRSRRHVAVVLGTALKVAAEWGRPGGNVVERTRKPQVERVRRPALTLEQARAFLAVVRGDRFEGVYRMALHTAMRISEILGLRWEDVDLERGRVSARWRLEYRNSPWQLKEIKTEGSTHTLSIPPVVVRVLRERRQRQDLDRMMAGPRWQDHGFVFTTSLGTPVSPTNMTRRYLKAALKETGLPAMSFHDLARRTVASLLAKEGMHPDAIRDLLGHASADLAQQVYTETLPGVSDLATDLLSRLLGDGDDPDR